MKAVRLGCARRHAGTTCGCAALVATHDPALLDLGDEVLHLADGRITEQA